VTNHLLLSEHNEAFQLEHENFFIEKAIKKSCLDIKMFDALSIICGNGSYCMDGLPLHNWSESFHVVQTRTLLKVTCN
jgi:hypothetical protein